MNGRKIKGIVIAVSILFISIGVGLLVDVRNKNGINTLGTDTGGIVVNSPMLSSHPTAVDINTPDDTLFRTEKRAGEPLTWWRYQNMSEYTTEAPEQRGSRYNLMTKGGHFRIEPFSVPPSIANDYNAIMSESQKIFYESYYENSWRGDPVPVTEVDYELVLSHPSSWNIKYIGVAWNSLYVTKENCKLELGGKWNPVMAEGSEDNAYLGWRSSSDSENIAMPFITHSLLRKYHYQIFASNDYYTWEQIGLVYTSHQNPRVYDHTPIRNPNDDQTVNPTRAQDDYGWDTSWAESDPNHWNTNNIYPYNGQMRPDGKWEDPSWSDIEYVSIPDYYSTYRYFKIKILAIEIEDGIGMFTGSTTNPLVAPEIGEIVFNYTINGINEDTYDATINSPINNSWFQVTPDDYIPVSIGTMGLTTDPTEDPSIDSIYFTIDGNGDNPILAYSRDRSVTITPPSISISPIGGWKNSSEIWNDTDSAYYLGSDYMHEYISDKSGSVNSDPPFINVNIHTEEQKWTGIYDVGVILKDYGKSSLHKPLDIQFEGNDTSVIGNYVTYKTINPSASGVYPYEFVKPVGNGHAVVLDHNLTASDPDPHSPLDYRYDYDILDYGIIAPNASFFNLSYQTMTDYDSGYSMDAWSVTPSYGLSLEFNYGYLGNPIRGKYEDKRSGSWYEFTAPTYGDNYLFLSFYFRAKNGNVNGTPHRAVLLVSGDPSTSDNLTIHNVYKAFVDGVTSEGALYTEKFASDPSDTSETFRIENFGTLCDYLIKSNDVDVFSDPSEYARWESIHGYDIYNISFISVLNTHRYRLLAEGTGDFLSQHTYEEFRPHDRSVDFKLDRYTDENGVERWKLYGEVENIETMNDSIYIDNITLMHIPLCDNAFTSVYASIESEGFFGYGPNDFDVYLENGDKNPRWFMAYNYPREVSSEENYDALQNFYEKSLLVGMGSVVLSPNSDYTMKIGIISHYGYGGDVKDPDDFPRSFQLGSLAVKGIVLIPRVTTLEGADSFIYASENNVDPLYYDFYHKSDETFGRSVIIRNAFYDAYTSGYEKVKRLESTIKTEIRSDSPKVGDYVEVTLNFPVSGYYDIYLRDSLPFTQTVDHNRYTLYIDGQLYRRYVQDYGEKIGYEEYMYYQRHLSAFEGTYQNKESDAELSKVLHAASDYFTAGSHVLKISFDGFEEYRYYNTTTRKVESTKDNFSVIRYDQILLYYKSTPSYRIPVSYFRSIAPRSFAHSITVHINLTEEYADLLGKRVLNYTTHFGIEEKPVINFKFGTMDNSISEVYGMSKEGDENDLKQNQYITDPDGTYTITAYVMGLGIDTSSLRYRINGGEWKQWDIFTSTFGTFIEMNATIHMNDQGVLFGKNVIETSVSNNLGVRSEAFLVFYYDPFAPNIEITHSSIPIGGNITDFESLNLTLSVSDPYGIIERVWYSNGLKASWNQNYRITRYVPVEIPIFDKTTNRRETSSITLSVSIPSDEIEQGLTNIIIGARDMAGNEKSITFSVNKVGTFFDVNFSLPNWRYVESDVPVYFNATIYTVVGGDKISSLPTSVDTKWIQFGYGDKNSLGYIYNKIETDFIARSHSISKVGLIFRTPMDQFKDYPAKIELLDGDRVLSSSYIFPSIVSPYTAPMRYVDIPDAILQIGHTYTIRITPFAAPYNIMYIKMASYTQNKEIEKQLFGESFGYWRGIRIPLDGYVIMPLYEKNVIPIRQAGDAYYSLNGADFVGPFHNGVINTTIQKNDNTQGWNNLTIKVDNGAGVIYSFTRQYRWLGKNYHSPPNCFFIEPIGGGSYRGNMTIRIKYDYPEWNETYRVQIFIQKGSDPVQWLTDLYVDELTTTDEIEYILDTNKTIEGIRWLSDSDTYRLMAFIDDGYDTYRAHSDYFTINNLGPSVVFLSPTYESRWNYNVMLKVNATTYGLSSITEAWVYYNDDPSYRVNIIPKFTKDLNGSKRYYFETFISISHLSVGENNIHVIAKDQYGRTGEAKVTIVRDIETYIEIEEVSPRIPNPYEETTITYSVFDDYKRVEIYLSYSEDYGESGFKRIAILEGDNITGAFSLGKLQLGSYHVIITAEDEAGNTYSNDATFNVIESGVLNSISEKVVGIVSLSLGGMGLAVIGINRGLARNRNVVCKITPNMKMCKGGRLK